MAAKSGVTVAGTAPDSHRLPFEPPPPRFKRVGGTLVVRRARAGRDGLSNSIPPDYAAFMTTNHARLGALLTAILIAAALRLVPHPPNFTPIGAMALFGGAYFGRRALAFAAPLGAMLLSDAILGFHSGMAYVYGSVALIVLIGWAVAKRITPLAIAGAAIASSVLFFAITNFGTWATGELYPPTLAGLEACFVAAIPFFQNTLAGDLFFAALLFGGFALLERWLPILRGPELRPA